MNIRSFIKEHPALTYFVLTFVISWGITLIIIAPGGIPGTTAQIDQLFPLALMALLVGPAGAGILTTLLVYGRAGWRDYLSRWKRWRVGIQWYAVALLLLPLLALIILLALARTSDVFLPAILTSDDKVGLLLSGLGIGLMGGFLEELGWTGFAAPELLKRKRSLVAGLIIGLLWGVWHLLVTFWASGDDAGRLSLPSFLDPFLFYALVLPVFRVLMVWLYQRSGSAPMVMLMHASLTAGTLFILQPAATGSALRTYYLGLAGALWLLVGIIAVFNGGKREKKSVPGAE
ncbi:MAG: CPBP family intramembrane metalloprotease [Anaerolineae bacterium]|nr:CPBP family intramembrane metalloprotease [Anaerolineae bacterium]